MLLVYSIKKFKQLILCAQTQEILSSEHLMRVHLYVFSINMVSYFVYCLTLSLDSTINDFDENRTNKEGHLIPEDT